MNREHPVQLPEPNPLVGDYNRLGGVVASDYVLFLCEVTPEARFYKTIQLQYKESCCRLFNGKCLYIRCKTQVI